MALAPFFDKAALAAAQAVQGLDHSRLTTRLEAEVIGIAFDAAAISGEGRVAVELLANLVARLYPRVALEPLVADAARLVDEIKQLIQAINPEVTWDLPAAATRCVVIGNTPVSTAAVYIGSRAWTATVRRLGPVGSGSGHNPFGAAVAACWGAAVIFHDIFADVLPDSQATNSVTWSLLDAGEDDLPAIDLGEVFLAGTGAVGNAFLWVLARLSGAVGTIHAVDPQTVDLGNLQRYILANYVDVGELKVNLAEAAFAASGLTVVKHPGLWAEAAAAAHYNIPLVAVALDSALARCEVQAALPRELINAWTGQGGDVGLSRHAFLGDAGCLMCLYLPRTPQPNEDQLVAVAIGLPEAQAKVRELLYSGHPITRELLERIAAKQQISIDALLPYEGRHLREFYSEAVCGGLMLRLGGSHSDGADTTVPLAHQSALAGILLAADVVIRRLALRVESAPSVTRYWSLKPFALPYSYQIAKHDSGKCICQDPDYVQAYRIKYQV